MKRLAILSGALLLALSACGGGDASGADRTLEVEMVDIAFRPTSINATKGERVRFVFTNTGKVVHDAFIGDRAAQDEHEREAASGDGGHGHGDTGGVTVKAGAKGELEYTFDKAGTFEIGCHEPGHYQAGMKITVQVA